MVCHCPNPCCVVFKGYYNCAKSCTVTQRKTAATAPLTQILHKDVNSYSTSFSQNSDVMTVGVSGWHVDKAQSPHCMEVCVQTVPHGRHLPLFFI